MCLHCTLLTCENKYNKKTIHLDVISLEYTSIFLYIEKAILQIIDSDSFEHYEAQPGTEEVGGVQGRSGREQGFVEG